MKVSGRPPFLPFSRELVAFFFDLIEPSATAAGFFIRVLIHSRKHPSVNHLQQVEPDIHNSLVSLYHHFLDDILVGLDLLSRYCEIELMYLR